MRVKSGWRWRAGPGATDQSPGRGAGPGHRIREVADGWLLGNLRSGTESSREPVLTWAFLLASQVGELGALQQYYP